MDDCFSHSTRRSVRVGECLRDGVDPATWDTCRLQLANPSVGWFPRQRFTNLRIDKRAVWNNWLLDFYVDVINATVAEESGGLVGGSSIRYLIPTLGFRAVL